MCQHGRTTEAHSGLECIAAPERARRGTMIAPYGGSETFKRFRRDRTARIRCFCDRLLVELLLGPWRRGSRGRSPEPVCRQLRRAVDRALGFGHVSLGATVQQQLHQKGGEGSAVRELSRLEEIV